jgi:hypothetical protein
MRETSNSISKQNSQQPKQFRGGEKKVMKKSFVSFALAASLLVSAAVPAAFAATPSDVVGKPVQSAVEELSALGILNGYEDGTFRPENEITRAELAKVIVIGSGNEAAATLMAGVKPSFKDVKAGAWYTGYINAAAAKGFIQGYNGNFRPSDPVKFEEVVAILVRALGYKEAKLSGAWPYNYLIAGTDAGLFEGVDITPGTLANRGIVAELTSNTINSDTVTYSALTGDLVTGDKLIKKIGITSSDILVSPKLTGDNKTVGLATLGEAKTATNFVVTNGKSLAGLLGREVTVIKNKAGDVVAISDAQDSAKVVVGTADSDNSTDTAPNTQTVAANGAVKVKVGTEQKSYTAAGTVSSFANYVSNVTLADGAETTLYLDAAGKVRFAVATVYVNDKVYSKYEAATSYRDARVTFKDNSSVDVVASTSVTINGAAAAATDLKENDVIRFVETSDRDAVVIEATRKAVSGKVEGKRTQDAVNYFTIGGTEYKSNIALDFNTEYTVYLNKDNVIVAQTTVNAATSTSFVVAIADTVDGKQIFENGSLSDPIYTQFKYYSIKDQKTVTVYPLTTALGGDPVATPAVATDINAGDVLELTYDVDGKITAISPASSIVNLGDANIASDVSATTVKVDGSTYLINSNTIVIDATGFGSEIVSVSDLSKLSNGDQIVVASKNGINASVIAIVSDAGATSGAVHGLFVAKAEYVASNGSKTYSVTLNVGGENKTYSINSTEFAKLGTTLARQIVKIDGTTVTVEVGLAPVVADAATEIAPLTNDDIANATFNTTPGTPASWIVSANTVVYVVDVNNNVAIGNYTDVKDAADALNNISVSVKPTVTVVQNGTSKVGTFNEAAVVIVKKNA